jgi:iron complex outermembrane recepter protein
MPRPRRATVEIIGQRPAAATALTTDTVSADVIAARHPDDLSEALDLVPGVAIENTVKLVIVYPPIL